ncbi:MAG: asparagine synthase-related protein [Aigarchaeota archaeon]|nr:asparagine synthase-related protein [Candidatus Pelearchaeum maunauluense]
MFGFVAAYGRGAGEAVKRALGEAGREAEYYSQGQAAAAYFGMVRRERGVKAAEYSDGRLTLVDAYPAFGVGSVEDARGLRGFFSAVMVSGEGLVLVRDHLGCRPLFIAETRGLIICSNTPAFIINAGYEPTPARPACITRLGEHGSVVETYWKPSRRHVKGDAGRILGLLRSSVERYVERGSALFFSGGLDSSILAKLCAEAGLEPMLVSAGLPGARDWANIKSVAKLLGIEATHVEISPSDVSRAVELLRGVFGRLSLMDAAIGSVFLLQAERARELGARSAVAGQGADELFGGYMKYEKIAERYGHEAVQEALWQDVMGLHAFSLPRDVLACSLVGVELVLPYLDYELVDYALSLPPELKVAKTAEGYVRKRILRSVALLLGLDEVARSRKSALQYGTGVQRVVERLVRDGKARLS